MHTPTRLASLLISCCAVAALISPRAIRSEIAQSSVAGEQPPISPTLTLTVPRAELRTPQEVEEAEAAAAAAPPQRVSVPFRPTMDRAAYIAAKEAAAGGTTIAPPPEAPLPLAAPVLKGLSFNGIDEIHAGGFPPDTHGAVGINHFVEITNSRFDVYSKSAGTRVKDVSLASFFGYSKKFIFDPRVVYDKTSNRWVVTAEANPESTTVQIFFIAASKTSDPTGAYFVYKLDVDFLNNNDFFDFPQLGLDPRAAIVTANVFSASGSLKGAEVFAVPKSALYTGGGFSVPIFTNLIGTLAPPIVLDQNSKTFLIAARPSGSSLRLYTMTNTGVPTSTSLSGPVSVSVSFYSLPPNSPQPSPCTGTSNTLDTGDARFANASTQIGTSLWQIHSIARGSTAAVKFYQINSSTHAVVQSGLIPASSTSFNFNVSVRANSSNDAFITWTSVNPSTHTNAQVRFSGRRHTDASGIGAGSVLFTSSSCLTGDFDAKFGTQRWGDYSAVSVDPTNSLIAWLVNEKINSSTDWGSRIAKIGF